MCSASRACQMQGLIVVVETSEDAGPAVCRTPSLAATPKRCVELRRVLAADGRGPAPQARSWRAAPPERSGVATRNNASRRCGWYCFSTVYLFYDSPEPT